MLKNTTYLLNFCYRKIILSKTTIKTKSIHHFFIFQRGLNIKNIYKIKSILIILKINISNSLWYLKQIFGLEKYINIFISVFICVKKNCPKTTKLYKIFLNFNHVLIIKNKIYVYVLWNVVKLAKIIVEMGHLFKNKE